MSIDVKIASRLDELIVLGRRVLATRRSPEVGVITDDYIDVQLANQWMTSCLNLLSRVFGDSSAHYQRMKEQLPKYPTWSNVNQAFGVLLAAQDDYASGSIFDMKTLIEADIFDDFLEQAEHLLEAGYILPAAVLTGSVLEDGLRKLCVRNDIVLADKPKLDSMNSDLAKKGTYSKLVQKRITAIADLRNNAAHGVANAFDKSDVDAMLRDVRDFMAKHFA